MRPLRASGSIRAPVAAMVGILLLACGSPVPRPANPTRPLDEPRAVDVIAKTFEAQNEKPIPGEPLELAEDKYLEVDVRAEGKKYGVAYVTPQERMKLGSALPPRDPAMGDALQLVTGLNEDADARILVLHDGEYTFDDHVGTEREATAITAERRLERDVRDFLVRAKAESWP